MLQKEQVVNGVHPGRRSQKKNQIRDNLSSCYVLFSPTKKKATDFFPAN